MSFQVKVHCVKFSLKFENFRHYPEPVEKLDAFSTCFAAGGTLSLDFSTGGTKKQKYFDAIVSVSQNDNAQVLKDLNGKACFGRFFFRKLCVKSNSLSDL